MRSYPIAVALGTLTAADYDFPSLVGGTIIVTPAPLTIRADDKSRAVGQPNPALTVSYDGFANGDGPSALTSPVALSTAAAPGSQASAQVVF